MSCELKLLPKIELSGSLPSQRQILACLLVVPFRIEPTERITIVRNWHKQNRLSGLIY
ncbi:hypothetical protein ACVWWO_005309 [Bradyrhizobium sp. F1.13.1]